MMMTNIVLKPFDVAAIVLAVGVIALSVALVYGSEDSRAVVKITRGGSNKETWVFFLDDKQASVSVPGPLGDTVVEVKDGTARVVASPCANQTCVAAGAIRRPGQWVACLPNQTLLLIEGSADTSDATDAVVW
ncbi:MAG: NusG domain II-containing protein [Treponema sp.]|nr:NusG domain II-containing protein [Treponema sp.]